MERLVFKSGWIEKLLAIGMSILIILLGVQAYNDLIPVPLIGITLVLTILCSVFIRKSIFNEDTFTHRNALGRSISGNYSEINEVRWHAGRLVMINLTNNKSIKVWSFEGDIVSLISWIKNKTEGRISISG
jgi:hypothetical protein